ncbi:Myb-like transcription factor [Fonsecaea pedrosoi]|nr:Myb-like transcription factor [Fonsecaea pedrosoi]
MSSPPPTKKQKQFASTTSSHINKEVPAPQATLAPKPVPDMLHPPASSQNPRKRRASHSPKLNTLPPGTALPSDPITPNAHLPVGLADETGKKRGRTNTPWTAQEEQRLKQMRDSGHSWSEIAKVVLRSFSHLALSLLIHPRLSLHGLKAA